MTSHGLVRRLEERVFQIWLYLAVPAVGVVPWVAGQLLPGGTWGRPGVIGVFFLAAVLRTGAAALRRPTGRVLPLMMTAALTMFGTGSMILALNPTMGFPSIAEVFFGSAYLCFTGFLVLDATGRAAWNLQALLETGVAAGGGGVRGRVRARDAARVEGGRR